MALLLLSFAVIKIVSGEPDAVFIVFVVPFVAGAGIWMAGFTTTITFNRDTGTMTVTRGHIPLFLWSLRKICISRESARTVRVSSRQVMDTTEYRATEYRVEVTTASGKTLPLLVDGSSRKANDLMRRIRRWSGPEY